MHLQHALNAILAAALLAAASGCSESKPARSPIPPPVTPLASNTVLRVHWAGKQTLGVAASAYSLMRIWNLPESRRFEDELLQRFASAPWRWSTNQPAASSQPVEALREALADVVNEECCLEIRRTPAGEQVVLGIQLDAASAARWTRSLANVLSSLEGNHPSHRPGGWFLRSGHSDTIYEFERRGSWVVLGAAKGTNALFAEITAQLQRDQAPFTTTNQHWLAVDADLRWLAGAIGLAADETADLPRVTMTVTGNGAQVITTGDLTYSAPLSLQLEPWALPLNRVREPLIGFSAVRGTGPWLTRTKVWKDLELGSAPNQIFAWADAGAPLQMRAVAPMTKTSPIAKGMAESVARKANAWLNQHGLGGVSPLPEETGIVWNGLPMVSPYLQLTTEADHVLLNGGLVTNSQPGNHPLPDIYPRPTVEELLTALNSQSNLVAYSWETTGARAESVHVLGQILRLATRHPQMPAGTVTSQWLENMRTRLGNATTVVTLAAPNRLAFQRKSTTGFNAFELHVIADWIESPQFPRGFYTTLSPTFDPATIKPTEP